WKAANDAAERVPLTDLARRAKELRGQVRSAEGPAERKRYLEKQLVGGGAEIRRLSGEVSKIDDECEALFDARPPHHEIEEFQAVHDRLGQMGPGGGPRAH